MIFTVDSRVTTVTTEVLRTRLVENLSQSKVPDVERAVDVAVPASRTRCASLQPMNRSRLALAREMIHGLTCNVLALEAPTRRVCLMYQQHIVSARTQQLAHAPTMDSEEDWVSCAQSPHSSTPPHHLGALMCEGGGFHAFWYSLGKGSVLRDHVQSVRGWSSGAMAAVLLVALPQIDFVSLISVALETKQNVRIGLGRLHLVVAYFLDKLLPHDAHLTCTGALGIILCDPRQCFCGRVETAWSSRAQLIACVVASTYVPGLVGMRLTDPLYRCVDGGISCNLKRLSANTWTTKGPPAGFLESFRPITKEHAFDLFERGRQDAIKFL